MRTFSKYSKTFGVIFGAAFIVSGANSLIANHTAAPSIATYSLTHDLALRLIGSPIEISKAASPAVAVPETVKVTLSQIGSASGGAKQAPRPCPIRADACVGVNENGRSLFKAITRS